MLGIVIILCVQMLNFGKKGLFHYDQNNHLNTIYSTI